MTIRLMREIRFAVGTGVSEADEAVRNTWAGWPASDDMVPYVVLRAVLSGPVDTRSGYVCNIKLIDRLLRRHAVSIIEGQWGVTPRFKWAGVLPVLWKTLVNEMPENTRLETLRIIPSPHLSYAVHRGNVDMVSMTYAFEFSAAHRLYSRSLSDAENERLFGRCANPNGHGHNYVLRVTLTGVPDGVRGVIVPLGDVTRIVNDRVIERFDHKHLNLDCPEFAEVNPSVENITRTIYEKLQGAFEPATVSRVRVYETPKTYAEYPAE